MAAGHITMGLDVATVTAAAVVAESRSYELTWRRSIILVTFLLVTDIIKLPGPGILTWELLTES